MEWETLHAKVEKIFDVVTGLINEVNQEKQLLERIKDGCDYDLTAEFSIGWEKCTKTINIWDVNKLRDMVEFSIKVKENMLYNSFNEIAHLINDDLKSPQAEETNEDDTSTTKEENIFTAVFPEEVGKNLG
jgi:hypothetical protein